ncbi:MAG: exodeoxyribonuclease VII large subunit [Chlorobiales bacterium]|nr:exodeoxyribonuclease VII large subunit [Chlorobiales bacterium]
MTEHIYTVSELTYQIKEELESRFPVIRLRGEVSNFKRHSSGHLYFTLKDEGAQIPAVIWRTTAARLDISIEDGLEVIVEGRIDVYLPSGRYQLICTDISTLGEGLLQQEFARLLHRLAAEGLFDESHKKTIPRLPEKIGIVTSETGAVIQDIRTVLARRYPAARLMLVPVRVQGDGAAAEIVRAIKYFNHPANPNHKPDVLIVGRGGGSLEDLWPFNEESVARAMYKSEIPVISAVGHETDMTIADLVADLRAGTPSMAAELAAPSKDDVLQNISGAIDHIGSAIEVSIDAYRRQINSILESYAFNRPRREIDRKLQLLESIRRQMESGLRHKWVVQNAHFKALGDRLKLLGHENILARGYVLVLKEGKPVRSASELNEGDKATLTFKDGIKEVGVK